MAFVPFGRLSVAQRAEAEALRPRWGAADLQRFQFWVRPDGHVSRKPGHHTLTDEAGAAIDAELRGAGSARSKTDLQDWSSGTRFHTTGD